ncbi:hypothetical protein IAU60_002186 [Kwoniella sp. DSM 27419]
MAFLSSTLAPRHLRSPLKPYRRSIRSLPFEILLLVLSQGQSPGLLAKLLLLNSEVYHIVLPYLYGRVSVDRAALALLIWGLDIQRPTVGPGSFVFRRPAGSTVSWGSGAASVTDTRASTSGASSMVSASSAGAGIPVGSSPPYKKDAGDPRPPPPYTPRDPRQPGIVSAPARPLAAPCRATDARKRHALSLVRTLILQDGADTHTAMDLLRILTDPAQDKQVLFPRLEHIVLDPAVLLNLAHWRHETRGKDHDLVEVLRRWLARPAKLPSPSDTQDAKSDTSSPKSADSTSCERGDKFRRGRTEMTARAPSPSSSIEVEIRGPTSLSVLARSSPEPFRATSLILVRRVLETERWRSRRCVARRRFTWHGLTDESLPLVLADRIEWHFAIPATLIRPNAGGTTVALRACEIRNVLFKDHELATGDGAGPSEIRRYRLCGSGSRSTYTGRLDSTGSEEERETEQQEMAIQARLRDMVWSGAEGFEDREELAEEMRGRVEWYTSFTMRAAVNELQREEVDELGGKGCGCFPSLRSGQSPDPPVVPRSPTRSRLPRRRLPDIADEGTGTNATGSVRSNRRPDPSTD